MNVKPLFGIPTDADIKSAAMGRTSAPTQEESCRRIVEALAREFPSWARDRAYAEYRVGVQMFGWDWEGFERDDDEAEAAAIDAQVAQFDAAEPERESLDRADPGEVER